MKNIKAIFFDLDGLLIDSDRLIFKAINDILCNFGKTISKKEFGEIFGLSGEELSEKVVNDFQINIPAPVFLNQLKSKIDWTEIKLKKGAVESLESLESLKDKYILALVTNSTKETLANKTNHLNIEKFFDKIIYLNHEILPKPAPDSYILAAKETENNPSDCLVLEDSEIGVVSALNAGCQAILIPNEYILNPKEISVKYKIGIYKTLKQLRNIFKVAK